MKSAVAAPRKGKRICEKVNSDHPPNMDDSHRTAAASTERYCTPFQLCHQPLLPHLGFATVVKEVNLPVKTVLCHGVACLL